MPYQAEASSVLLHRTDNLKDWKRANPGQWFIGVVNTRTRAVFLVPVNVFEGRGGLNQETINNANMRGINRYASGAPGERTGENLVPFDSTRGPGGNWLEGRPNGQTHHTAVALKYGQEPAECLGFTLIKVALEHFAQMKCGSNSLNQTKPDHTINHSFSRSTRDGTDFSPGSAQVPPQWIDALLDYFKGGPFDLKHIVKSND
ncbi:MAG: hypothetical protein AB8G99_23565 [Planctomycetaceae bacterium]